jgi:hypothetical protein
MYINHKKFKFATNNDTEDKICDDIYSIKISIIIFSQSIFYAILNSNNLFYI